MTRSEYYFSIDVETAGPYPGRYALLSIGACVVFEPERTFYVELKPDKDEFSPEALSVSGLDMDALYRYGQPPGHAMQQFADWVTSVTPAGKEPVFTAFNAPFDWMFVNDYFHRYLGKNPFRHAALDMKAYSMGLLGLEWHQTGFERVRKHIGIDRPLSHHALQDALDQAELFKKMLEARKK